MIYYFSGTGNSQWVAKKIGNQIGEEAISIPDAIKENRELTVIKEGQCVGFVFPIYAWAAPEIVMNYISNVTVEKGAFCFAVCTCGEEAGLSMKKLAGKLPLNSAYSIVMPNNYIIGFDVDSEDVAKQKIENAKTKIAEICADITERKNVWDVNVGTKAFLKSNVASWGFNRFARNAKPYSVDETCTSCGICEKVCPTQNIELKEGRPLWGNNCLLCLACINRCPVKAIQYGEKTKNKGRYFFGNI